MERKAHWEGIYTTKSPTVVSWYQTHATKSLELIRQVGVDSSARIIDVGGGASTLVDDLLAEGFRNLTVLDISGAAFEAARQRLAPPDACDVTWLEADVTQSNLPCHSFDLWHDRAVISFTSLMRNTSHGALTTR
ncbi:MAG: class I SAM-dependent methyltransferase [Pyrinomonadaceae bacterium]|nr:class I SAM-dependent methyltransferase [Pyrinomonadaceae bacterium]